MTFDKMLDALEQIFSKYASTLSLKKYSNKFFVNRSVCGRVTLVFDNFTLEQMDERERLALDALCQDIAATMGSHVFPNSPLCLEAVAPFKDSQSGAVVFTYGQHLQFTVVDRMLTESNFSLRAHEDDLSAKMIAFFSIKGGVGRSTALAACAWHLARHGKKIMVVDLDLESPGLSSSLIPKDLRPDYGLLDWLVEDVVDNGAAVFDQIWAKSPLASRSLGEITVIPAHGRNYGDYLAKLERSLMYRMDQTTRIAWPKRLHKLLYELDQRHKPDYVLLDARSGLSEVASASVFDLAPKLVLLFARDGIETWADYALLFEHWKIVGQSQNIRHSLKMVAGMIPPFDDQSAYLERFRKNAWKCFLDGLYALRPNDNFSFACNDPNAPHNPWCIHWNQDLYAIRQLYNLEETLGADMILATFPYLRNLDLYLRR